MIDFFRAANRHYRDGEYLLQDKRHPNAGQLFGFAAECGIKALLVASGYPTNPATGDMEKACDSATDLRKHINILASGDSLRVFLDGRGGSACLARLESIKDFSDWDISHRYWTDHKIPLSCEKWRNAAKEVVIMLDSLKLDGRIS